MISRLLGQAVVIRSNFCAVRRAHTRSIRGKFIKDFYARACAQGLVSNNMPWSFLIVPVGIGALLLALFAFVWHNLVAQGANKGDTWPMRWW
jgi:hypothetical protein